MHRNQLVQVIIINGDVVVASRTGLLYVDQLVVDISNAMASTSSPNYA